MVMKMMMVVVMMMMMIVVVLVMIIIVMMIIVMIVVIMMTVIVVMMIIIIMMVAVIVVMMVVEGMNGVLRHFQQYFSHITATVHIIHALLGLTSTRLGSEVSCPKTLPRKNPEDPVWLEPRTPGLRVKHFTTGPHGTLVGGDVDDGDSVGNGDDDDDDNDFGDSGMMMMLVIVG